MLYFDITNLITYARDNQSVSGIQRVTLEAQRNLDNQQIPIFLSRHTMKWYCVHGLELKNIENLESFRNLAFIADLCDTLDVDNHRRYTREHINRHRKLSIGSRLFLLGLSVPGIKNLLASVAQKLSVKRFRQKNFPVRTMPLPAIQPQDTLCFFGAPWDFQDHYIRFLNSIPKATRRVFLIYDLIPLVCPYVPDDLRDKFRIFIPWMINEASQIIVNSDSCKKDLIAFAGRNKQGLPPIAKAQLAHRLPKTIDENEDPQSMSLRLRKLIPEKFVLCVGSIESRKNHLNLLILWAKFVHSEYYTNQKLVIAGRWLWDVTAIQNLLHETGHIFGSVIIMDPPPSDTELQQLYRYCRFTVFPSHYEGWGLPVGESLSFGKPCLTFDNSALKEVGWGLSHTVDNYDYDNYYNQFIQLMCDETYYQESVARIRANNAGLRSWADFSKDIQVILL